MDGLSFSSHPKVLLGVVGVVTRCHLDSTRHGLPGIPGDPGKLKPISIKDGRRGTAPAPPFAPVDAGTDIEVETGAPSPWRPTPGKPIYFRSLLRSRKKTPFITELVRGPSCRKISGVMKNHPLQWGDQTIQMYCHYQNLRGSKTTMSLTFQGLPWSRIASILVNPSSSRRIQPGGGTSIWTVKDQLYTSTRIPGVSPKISDKTRKPRNIYKGFF